MDATIFLNDTDIVFNNFNKVLKLLVFCYKKIISEISFKWDEFETFIRNIFIKQLRENKDDFWIWYSYFEAETEEIKENNQILWFLDIKVWNIEWWKLINEDKYFAFECKRLDWYATKNKEYLKNWISRFEKWQYSKLMNIAWMIWFIQWYKKWENITHLVNEFKTKIEWLSFYEIEKDFKYSYLSLHKRGWALWNIDIYHLFFDFT